ncbi:class I SAM-dependent methyltransferase [Jidongwangia harbinensis]|uniref:class I SAM-dependent methyltransferase n=1 Tax=Jidongwangia harbinensis TaxID=2878561 RepID=UPI001CD9F561|nr:methyltransferase domain-containing protein [Jidongwangia harbinensis]MCA2214934.1 class I SAM-dependent methyltransferase [Jidongwangia harbinensis]
MGIEDDADRLAAASLAAGDPTGWFDRLYTEAAAGDAQVPWDRPEPGPLLVDWARRDGVAGAGRTALVVGCGLGRDAEFVAGLGFATTAFDISPTAVRVARERHRGTTVDYRVADLFDPPPSWRHGSDLVVESNTVQALPRSLRERAAAAVAALVAPGGTLLVLAAQATDVDQDGPPWPLTRAEVDLFATGGLTTVAVERLPRPGDALGWRWRAEFRATAS